MKTKKKHVLIFSLNKMVLLRNVILHILNHNTFFVLLFMPLQIMMNEVVLVLWLPAAQDNLMDLKSSCNARHELDRLCVRGN